MLIFIIVWVVITVLYRICTYNLQKGKTPRSTVLCTLKRPPGLIKQLERFCMVIYRLLFAFVLIFLKKLKF